MTRREWHQRVPPSARGRTAFRAAILVLGGLPLAVGAFPGTAQAPASQRLLYLTHSAGYRHQVLPLSQDVVRALGRTAGFEVTVSEDASVISDAGLRDYDAVFFYTSGELPLSDAQKRALLAFVKGGKGFVGAHSATDTLYRWPEYGEMIGGYFDGHPWHTTVGVRVEDRVHPATQHLPARFELADEIYQFKNWSRDRVHVLLSLDPASVELSVPGVRRIDRDFALAWTRRHGEGRVFYTALGHNVEVWRDERFTRHLLGGIRWAMAAATATGETQKKHRGNTEEYRGNTEEHRDLDADRESGLIAATTVDYRRPVRCCSTR